MGDAGARGGPGRRDGPRDALHRRHHRSARPRLHGQRAGRRRAAGRVPAQPARGASERRRRRAAPRRRRHLRERDRLEYLGRCPGRRRLQRARLRRTRRRQPRVRLRGGRHRILEPRRHARHARRAQGSGRAGTVSLSRGQPDRRGDGKSGAVAERPAVHAGRRRRPPSGNSRRHDPLRTHEDHCRQRSGTRHDGARTRRRERGTASAPARRRPGAGARARRRRVLSVRRPHGPLVVRRRRRDLPTGPAAAARPRRCDRRRSHPPGGGARGGRHPDRPGPFARQNVRARRSDRRTRHRRRGCPALPAPGGLRLRRRGRVVLRDRRRRARVLRERPGPSGPNGGRRNATGARAG